MNNILSKILVVDDFPTGRRLLAHKLKENYNVITAASGIEAVALAEEHRPDIILLDVEMPEMDGFQTLEHLRNGVIDNAVPVIFVTARNDKESRNRGLEAGAVDFLSKPYDKEELLIKVRNHLALYEARKQIDQANKRMAEELKMASELQRSLLPNEFPSNERVRFSAVYLPTSEASGDLYDAIALPDGRIAFAQVDVSGHGVRSAMIGAMFKMSFQSIVKANYSPAQFLSRLNNDMVEVTPDMDYLTAFCGIIDPHDLTLVYSNAAHPRPFLYKKTSEQIIELKEGGIMIGFYPGFDYEEGRAQLESGDIIMAYTDGITEARHREQKLDNLYGRERLKELFLNNLDKEPERLLSDILLDVQDFQGAQTYHDDVCILLLSIK
jgi:phosphoserine phosphatase RsbU/P